MITRALVTGGAGFMGSNLVDRLVDDGAHVLVVDDLSTGRLERLREARSHPHQMVFHQIDVRAQELHDVVTRFEPDVVFHLAATPDGEASRIDPAADASINVVGTVNVLHAAVTAGADRFVYASSAIAVYGETERLPTPESAARRPTSPRGAAIAAAEDYVRFFGDAYGLRASVLRFATVYGPRQTRGAVAAFTASLLKGERATVHGDGTQTRDLVFVEDATDACIRAADAGDGLVANVGSGAEVAIADLYAMLRDLTARGKLEPHYVEAPPGTIARTCLDVSRAEKHLGWQPWTSLDRGLRQTVEWFRSRG